jgi:hypothetical protein
MTIIFESLYNSSRIREAGENLSEERIAWHPAFVEAIQAELEEYKDVLEFHAEYPLTTEPLRIDVLIVRKLAGTVIRKNIARIFREHNIVEYKSPGDHVSLADFQKVYSYAWLYAALHNLLIENLTITVVENGYPRKVIQHLTNQGCSVEESEPGLYIVKGTMIPVQIIESEKLSTGENMWLKNLRKGADTESFAKMLRAVQEREKGAHLRAYLNVLLVANPKILKEVKKTMIMTPELREVFIDIGFAAEWEEKGWEKGREEGREEGQIKMAKNLLAHGIDPVIIAESSGLALDEIRKIAD